MKVFNLILILIFLLSCSFNKQTILNDKETYYFYFENNDNTMKYIYSKNKNRKKYFYHIEMADKIFFDAIKKNDTFNIKELKVQDTIGLNIKDYDWLNQFDNTSKYRFFNKKPFKKYYIIEKTAEKDGLYLIEVKFIDEIN